MHRSIIIIATIIILDLRALSGLTKFSPESEIILNGALMITHDCSGKRGPELLVLYCSKGCTWTDYLLLCWLGRVLPRKRFYQAFETLTI